WRTISGYDRRIIQRHPTAINQSAGGGSRRRSISGIRNRLQSSTMALYESSRTPASVAETTKDNHSVPKRPTSDRITARPFWFMRYKPTRGIAPTLTLLAPLAARQPLAASCCGSLLDSNRVLPLLLGAARCPRHAHSRGSWPPAPHRLQRPS